MTNFTEEPEALRDPFSPFLFFILWPGKSDFYFLNTVKERGPSPNGGRPLSRGLGLIRKDPGWRASCSCLCITPPPPTPHAACLLNLWCPRVLVQVASERSRWDAVPNPHPTILTPHTRPRVSCLPGLGSSCTQLPLTLVQMYSGCQATGGMKEKCYFFVCLFVCLF